MTSASASSPERGVQLPALDGPRLRAVPAGPADAGPLQACLEGAPDYFERAEGGPPSPDAAARLLEDAEADPLRQVFALVPASGGAAIGVLDVHLHHPEPRVAHVGLLLFRESCQGLGYGAETMSALEHALAREGFSAVRCAVGDENPGAKAFWERIDYAEVGRLDGGVTLYERRLG